MYSAYDIADKRMQPGAYITDGIRLYEVLQNADGMIALQDCRTMATTRVLATWVAMAWQLVREAPQPPETVEAGLALLA